MKGARAEAPDEDAELVVSGPVLRVRIPRPGDAAALFAAGSDAEVTRWFSWGPYEREDQAAAYLTRLPAERESGQQLDLVVDHRQAGPIGITGLSELVPRDRRATIGTWLGREWWGTGANAECKALVCHLAFEVLGLERLSSYTNVDHARSQRALERLGFQHEGALRGFHRHGDQVHDVAVFGLLRADWEGGPLRDFSVTVSGEAPRAFVVSS